MGSNESLTSLCRKAAKPTDVKAVGSNVGIDVRKVVPQRMGRQASAAHIE